MSKYYYDNMATAFKRGCSESIANDFAKARERRLEREKAKGLTREDLRAESAKGTPYRGHAREYWDYVFEGSKLGPAYPEHETATAGEGDETGAELVDHGIEDDNNDEEASGARASTDGRTPATEADSSSDEDRISNIEALKRANTDLADGYDYTPLADASGTGKIEPHIRLLKLLPFVEDDDDDDDLYCNIQTCNIAKAPRYEALSYCWGDAEDTLRIHCNGRPLAVTQNLYAALHRLRLPAAVRTLWVDAICINQQDVEERSSQVKLMRSIYEHATRTVVWLGPDNDNVSGDAFATVTRSAAGTLTSLSANEEADAEDGIRELLRCSWFERIWVVQELAVASDAVVVWGDYELSWTTISAGLLARTNAHPVSRMFFGLSTSAAFLYPRFSAIATVRPVRLEHQQWSSAERATSLLNLLTQFRTYEATDPRDKIFALLGLAVPEDAEIDYRLTAIHLFRLWAQRLLLMTDNLDLFGQCLTLEGSTMKGDLPSWVPDWSNAADIATPVTRKKDLPSDHRAAGMAPARITILHEFAVIGLSGYPVDSVAELADTLPVAFNNLEEVAYITDWDAYNGVEGTLRRLFRMIEVMTEPLQVLVRWEKFAGIANKKAPEYRTGESHRSVYWRTLCTDYMPKGRQQAEHDFDEWFAELRVIRRLARLGLVRARKLFATLSLTAYIRATWQKYGAFRELMEHAYQRRLARTHKGYLALVPASTKVGDLVGLFRGGRVPLVSRSEGEHCSLVGESCVHGIMQGEAFQEQACKPIYFQ